MRFSNISILAANDQRVAGARYLHFCTGFTLLRQCALFPGICVSEAIFQVVTGQYKIMTAESE